MECETLTSTRAGCMQAKEKEKAAGSPPVLSVEAIMVSEVRTASPDSTVREAIQLLLEYKIGGAPIVDNFGHLVSVVTEGDLLKLAAAGSLDSKLGLCLTQLPKTDKLVTLSKTATFAEAYKIFLSRSIRRILIVDSNGKLQGLVSRSNILRTLTGPSSSASTGSRDGLKEVLKEEAKKA